MKLLILGFQSFQGFYDVWWTDVSPVSTQTHAAKARLSNDTRIHVWFGVQRVETSSSLGCLMFKGKVIAVGNYDPSVQQIRAFVFFFPCLFRWFFDALRRCNSSPQFTNISAEMLSEIQQMYGKVPPQIHLDATKGVRRPHWTKAFPSHKRKRST